MEGKEVRNRGREFRVMGDSDDSGLKRLSEFNARFLHAAGRTGTDVDDTTRRSCVWWSWLRTVRHAGICNHRGFHCRADDRAHAGIPG